MTTHDEAIALIVTIDDPTHHASVIVYIIEQEMEMNVEKTQLKSSFCCVFIELQKNPVQVNPEDISNSFLLRWMQPNVLSN